MPSGIPGWTEDTPGEQLFQRMFDLIRITKLFEAFSELCDQAQPFIGFPQQEDAGVGGDHFAVEFGNDSVGPLVLHHRISG